MTDVIPFRGIIYNTERVSGDDVIAPPYDIITEESRAALYGSSPYNVVRVDAGMEIEGDGGGENKYVRARRFLDEWLREGILKRSERPSIYLHRMDYSVRGKAKSLTGVFALVKLVEPGGGVYPHEATYSKPKRDRLTLLDITGANTSPIFSLYNNPEGGAETVFAGARKTVPYLKAVDAEGTAHSLWCIEEASAIKAICSDISGRPVYIADGHHRYETALEYRNMMREKAGSGGGGDSPSAFDFVLMFLANMALGDEAITILPTHRLIRAALGKVELGKIAGRFDIETLPAGADIISSMEGLSHAIGLYTGGKSYLLGCRGGSLEGMHPALGGLDVVVLHELLLKRVLDMEEFAYEMDPAKAVERVRGGDYGSAFFLNPTRLADVEAVALSGLRMPPKSTYFYPKVPAGLVMNSLSTL